MESPPEFIKKEEIIPHKAPYAMAATAILLFVFMFWAITAYVENRRAEELSQSGNMNLSQAEKELILEQMSKEEFGEIDPSSAEKKKALNNLSKNSSTETDASASEKQMILLEMQSQ